MDYETYKTMDVCKHPWDRTTVAPVKDFVVTEDMWDRLWEICPKNVNIHGDYRKQVCDLFTPNSTQWSINKEEVDWLDERIASNNFDGPQLQVLLGDYKGHIHLNQLSSHVEAILEIFDNPMVKEYCKDDDLDREDLENHDITKTGVIEIAAYTYRFVHGADVFDDPRFQIGLEHHFYNSAHHPQYWQGSDMWHGLMESILDIAACRYEQDLGRDPNALLSDIFNIPDVYLQHYTEADRKRVEDHLKILRNIGGTVCGV